jgi:hypothetical protein
MLLTLLLLLLLLSLLLLLLLLTEATFAKHTAELQLWKQQNKQVEAETMKRVMLAYEQMQAGDRRRTAFAGKSGS